jgi:putative aldouronate transport system permease protein
MNKSGHIKYPLRASFKRNYELYIFLVPALIFTIVFLYAPMYGILIAFKRFNPVMGIWGSEWVGLKYFKIFFNSYSFTLILKNTLILSFYSLIAGFPLPIILAILLHHMPSKKYKKIVQMSTYIPHFISIVVLVGMIKVFLAPDTGVINVILQKLGFESVFFMGKSKYFAHIYVWSGVWQTLGFSSIIYIAALSSISPELYEAAEVDGATLFQKIKYIDIPGITPTAIIILLLSLGQIMSIGFEKVFLMQNPTNLAVSEIISTYVYRIGIIQSNFEIASAVGLFNSLVNATLLVMVNAIAKRYTESSLF